MPSYVRLDLVRVTYAPIRTGWRAGLEFRAGSGVTLTPTEDPNVGVILTISASGGGGTAASTVVAETSYGGASAVGVSTNYAREDHTHGSPSLDTDGTLAANSDTAAASQKAVKTYVDNAVTGLFDFKGNTDCSANPNYPAASKGDAYVVSVAGKIGGVTGKSVDVGDLYVAKADNAGGIEASVGTSWFVLEHNLVGALLAANNLSDLASASAARTNLGLGSVATLDVDTDGTLAANSDAKVASQKATKTYALTGGLGATDNALLRADGTGGKTAQGSVPTLSDAGALAGLTGITSTGAVDLSGASSLLVPASAGAAPTAAESLAYDSTRKVLVHGDGSAAHVVYSGVMPVFGSGVDGAIVADGTTPFVTHGATITPTGSPGAYLYTLSRPMSATNLTISAGVTIDASQYPITVSGTLTFTDSTSIIRSGGTDASGTTAGAGIATGGTLNSAWSQGGNGRTTAGIGPNGTAQANTQGGSGGGGGSVTGQAGGSGGTASVPGSTSTYASDSYGLMNLGYRIAAGTLGGMQGGAGGAGGGNLANSNSGGGGGGGGTLYVAAAKIVGAGVFRAKGGNGGNAALLTGLGGGGGGGGGGGQIIILTIGQGYTFTTDVTGGTKGTGVGASGTDGVNGSAGLATIVSL